MIGRDLLIPLAGAVVFAVGGILCNLLVSGDLSYVSPIAGGIAFGLTWFVVSLIRRRSNGESEKGDGD